MNRLRLGILAIVTGTACAQAGIMDLYVTSDAMNKSTMYQGATGNLIQDPFTTVANGAAGPLGIHFGTSNNRVLVGHFNGGINEFDATTGAFIKSYNNSAVTMNWAGVYGPGNQVYAGDMLTNTVWRYNATTGAQIGPLASVPQPSDMRFGPNGNLYVCSFTNGGGVYELNPISGAQVNWFPTPAGTLPNDIAFLPSGRVLVTTMDISFGPGPGNQCWVYDSSYNLLTNFSGTGWGRTHGIDISPFDGNIHIIDGVTAQDHVFDPVTYAELNAAFLNPMPEAKTVDLEFRPVPEPSTVALAALGSVGLLRRRS